MDVADSRVSRFFAREFKISLTSWPWLSPLLAICCIFLVALRWWHPGLLIAQGDLPPVIDPWNILHRLGLGWSDYSSPFGQLDGSFAFYPYVLLWAFFDSIAGSSLGQILVNASVLAIAWLGCYRLLRGARLGEASAWLASWLYILNPFMQVTIGQNPTNNAFFAIMPWVAWCIIAPAARPTRQAFFGVILVLLAGFVIVTIGITPQLVFQLGVNAAIFGGMGLLLTSDRRAYARWFCIAAGLAIIASLWWLLPDALSYVGARLQHPADPATNDFIYWRSSLLNNLRFAYLWGWGYDYYFPYAPGFDANLLTYAGGFTGIFVAGFGLFVVGDDHRRRLLRYALIVALGAMFICKGLHAPLSWLNVAFFHIPFTFLYQDTGGATNVALLALALASGLTLDSLFGILGRPNVMRVSQIAVALVFIAGICASAEPMLTGDIFHGPTKALPSMYVSVPEYWYQARGFINAQSGRGSVLLLPPNPSNGYNVTYTWGYKGADAFALYALNRPVLTLGMGMGYTAQDRALNISATIRSLLYSNSALIKPILRNLGFRYVIVRGDVVDDDSDVSNQQDIRKALGTPVQSFGPLDIYDVGEVPPPIRLYDSWISSVFDTYQPGRLAELGSLEESLPRIDPRQLSTDLRAHFPASLTERSFGFASSEPTNGVIWPGYDLAANRIVTFSPDPANRDIAYPSGPSSMSVSLANEPPRELVAYSPLAKNNAVPLNDKNVSVLPSAVVSNIEEKGDSHVITFTVYNPQEQLENIDVNMVVPGSAKSQVLTLAGFGTSAMTVATAGQGPRYVHFDHVLLAPGVGRMSLMTRAAAARDGNPAVLAIAPSGARIYKPTFRFRSSSGVYKLSLASPNSATTSSFWPVAGWRQLALFDSPLPLLQDPLISLVSTQSLGHVVAALDFSYSRRLYSCIADLDPSQSLPLRAAVAGCLSQNNFSTSPSSLDAAVVRSFTIYSAEHIDDTALSAVLDRTWLAVRIRPIDVRESELSRARISANGTAIDSISWNSGGASVVVKPQQLGANQQVMRDDMVALTTASGVVNGRVASVDNNGLFLESSSGAQTWYPFGAILSLHQVSRTQSLKFEWAINGPIRAGEALRLQTIGCQIERSIVRIVADSRNGLRTLSFPTQKDGDLPGSAFGTLLSSHDLHLSRLSSVQLFCVVQVSNAAVSVSASARRLTPGKSMFNLTLNNRFQKTNAPLGSVVSRRISERPVPLMLDLASSDPRVSVAAFGSAPSKPKETLSTYTPIGLRSLGYVWHGNTGSHVLLLNQMFNWSWLAIALQPFPHILPHCEVDGWRNGWFVWGVSSVTVVNIISWVQALLLAVSVGSAILAWRVLTLPRAR